MDARTYDRDELKRTFIANRGYWSGFWEGLLALHPEFFAAYLDFSSIPWKQGPLPPKVKEFIYIAIDASTTHLYEPGLRIHIENALKYGATKEEILEVLQLTSVLGMHTCTMGVPALIEELKEAGQGGDLDALLADPERQRLKEEFIRNRGYWSDFWDGLLILDPAFFQTYLRFSSIPWKSGPLEPKVKEFIYIAIDAATTHLYEPGLRIHYRNALKYGATKEELMEVLQLTSVLGMHTCTMGVPILIDELRKAGQAV
ncbi:MAG: carboxymuconolactone decarboxylase family protein [Rhodobacteraceae bacterium]|jgi:alkylhydroperoxidase/carboxymuconolactone decarboxylase family protein YurZ|nr:carboxymuconolactone decarboxylase family protein [Paracoccaceae bacterium]